MSTEGNTGNTEGRTGQQQSPGNCKSATESSEQGIPIPMSLDRALKPKVQSLCCPAIAAFITAQLIGLFLRGVMPPCPSASACM